MSNGTKSHEKYRSILSIANKLETLQCNQESVIDLFRAPIIEFHSQLRNDCLTLIFETEFKLDHFRKVEELIWKRIYHDVYRFHKSRKSNNPHEEYLVYSHFISGIGFYSSLIVKLRIYFKIHEAHGLLLPLNFPVEPISSGRSSRLEGDFLKSEKEVKDEQLLRMSNAWTKQNEHSKEWAQLAIYRSLIYMGDLARYLSKKNEFDFHKLAFEFYKSASKIQPSYGLPYNQLATLVGNHNCNLHAVCNYMRCALKPKPFEGAEGNMRKIFDVNNRLYHNLKYQRTGWLLKFPDVVSDNDRAAVSQSMLQALVIVFIKLTSDIWNAISNKSDDSLNTAIADETQLFFECLCEATELGPLVPLVDLEQDVSEFCPLSCSPTECEKSRYICPTMMFEFCCITVMLLTKNDTSVRPGDTSCLSNLINTLALNLLHYASPECRKLIKPKIRKVNAIAIS